MTIKIQAAQRIKVMAADAWQQAIKDLKAVGFKVNKHERGVWTCQELDENAAKKMCDKMLKLGYKSQGRSLYPNEDGEFYVENDEVQICVDPSGYVYLT